MNKVRCAIYTRKSSEEGLEQDFNSLDAQREACAAYILSQASEGWQMLPGIYDDGGISGGTLERPALQRLLADIAAGEIDIVVVYKVDRLSRSLFDFAKLVEVFEKAGTSFVSVTQSFNTTTSMGRLTLNMLLSFAQFEREVTAERIRDKLAASKAKGMWMGATPPLGYRPDGRSLAIVEEHAEVVRDIYRRYLKLGNIRLVGEQLNADGIRVPQRVTAGGRAYGGGTFTRGQLYHMLRNATYTGQIVHRDKRYPGLHSAIIDPDTWDRVQQRLTDNTQGEERARLPNRSLLAGLIVDATGEPMLATHASKKSVRYRYYISRSLQTGESTAGLRLPAREIEAAVKEEVARAFNDPLLLASQLALSVSPALLRTMTERCAHIAAELRGRSAGPLREIVTQVRAGAGKLDIILSVPHIADVLGTTSSDWPSPTIVLSIEYRLTRTGNAMRLVHRDGTSSTPDANLALVNRVVQARKWWGMLASGEIDIRTLARQVGCQESYVSRVVRAAFLSPEVIDAILSGRQHGMLTAAQLHQPDYIPVCWHEQAAKFLPTTSGSAVGLTSQRA